VARQQFQRRLHGALNAIERSKNNENAQQKRATRNLFGPPPVLSSEDRDHYNEMWGKLTECLNAKRLRGVDVRHTSDE
jgi:hypothetical protein